MKKLVLLLTLTLSALSAHAELGETKAQSASRYGKPFSVAGNRQYYKHNGFVVCEWFDAKGLAEVICYWKLSGYITEPEARKMGAANLPATVKADDWIEQTSQDDNTRAWITMDNVWYCESGLSQLNGSKTLYSSFAIGTLSGCRQSLSELHNENPNNEESSTAQRTDI